MKHIAVIGAGAAGLMAALAAAQSGARVTLLEKNEKAGKKLYITGKGRCNVTNDTTPEGFLENVVHGRKFLIGAIRRFSPADTMRVLEEGGVPLKVERGGRVFPVSDKASDVTRCLEALCRRAGAEICFQEEVRSLQKQGEGFLVQTSARALEADAVVVCTGGVSYPATGSTGDGYAFARRFGLSVTPPKAALCGIACAFRPEDDLQGLSLKNVRLSALDGGKAVQSFFGELLFAHFGISGPVTLSLSSFVNERDLGRVALEIDLKPALDDETLDRRILRDLAQEKNKQLGTVLRLLLPQRLIASVLARAGVAAATPAHSLTKEGRRKLVHALKHFSLRPTALRPVEEAIVTAGGVDVRELDPKTMQSKKVAGLYFAGEVIDADALTGGYNLQTAFTTGYIAGKSASF